MDLKQIIEESYGSIDTFLEETDIQISRTYLYELINNKDINPSLNVMEELARVLTDKDIERVVKAIHSSRYRD